MANKKINELDSRASLSLSDLLAVGDPTTGYLYKITITDLKSLTGAGVISFNGRVGAVSPAEGDYTLNQLGDVIITSPSNGQVLKYNGSNWVNTAEAGETDTLDSVTTRGNTTNNSITVQNVSATGLIVSSGAVYTNVGFYSNNNGNLRYTFDTNDLVLKAGTSTSNNYMRVFGATGNIAIGSDVDAGYKLDVNGDVRANIYRGANGSPLITFDAATNRVKVDGQGYGTTLGNSVIIADYLSVEARAVFNTLVRVKGNNSVVSFAISRPDAPALDSAALAGMGAKFNTTWYTGAGLSFYVSEGADISSGYNIVEKLHLSPSGDFKVVNLAGTGTRIVTVDANGVLSAGNALSGYVPYTGATANVNLGDYTLTTGNVWVTNSASNAQVNIQQTLTGNIINTGYTSIWSTGNNFYIGAGASSGSNSKSMYFDLSGLTNNTTRAYALPNANGTLALTSDITSALANYVTLDGVQTITAQKTFTSNVRLARSSPSIDAYAADNTTYYGSMYINSSFFQFTAAGSAEWLFKNGSGNNVLAIQQNGTATFTGSVSASSVTTSAYRLDGMTAGAGALYYNSGSNRVTVANYNASGIVVIETNGGAETARFGGSTYANDFTGTGRFTGAVTLGTGGSAYTFGGGSAAAGGLTDKDLTLKAWSPSSGTNEYAGDLILSSGVGTGNASGKLGSVIIRVGTDGAGGSTAGTNITSTTFTKTGVGIGSTTGIAYFKLNVDGHAVHLPNSYATDGANDPYRAGVGWQSFANPGVVLSSLITANNVGNYGADIVFLNRGSSGGNMREKMKLDSNGVLIVEGNTMGWAIGQVSGINRIQYNGSSFVLLSSGNGYTAIAASAFNVNSDYRLKEDLKDFNNSLDIVKSIKIYDFKWKDKEERNYGVIAHELQEVLPYIVYGEKDGLESNGDIRSQGVDYGKLVPVLVKAIQEQQTEIETLKARLN